MPKFVGILFLVSMSKFPELDIPDFYKLSKESWWNPKVYSPMVFNEKIMNMAEKLKPGTIEYDDFWDEMDYYCINGFKPKGKMPRISGRYFFYLNFCKIKLLPKGGKMKVMRNPLYRDLDHWLFLEIEAAEKYGYGLIIAKPRQVGLSEIGSGCGAYNLRFYKGSEIAVATGHSDKFKEFKQKLESTIANIHPAYQVREDTNNEHLLEYQYYDVVNKTRKVGGIQTKARFKTMYANSGAFEGINNCKLAIFEEAGLFENLTMSFKATAPAFRSGALQYGLPMVYGCVCAGTKVWTNDGRLVNIEDLQQSDGIIGYDGNGASKEPIIWQKPSAKKPCYRIKTTGGVLECSHDHPLMSVIRKKKNKRLTTFKKAEELNVGDILMCLSEVPVFGNEKVKDARLLGLMIGDGNYTKKQIPQLSVGDFEIGNYIKKRYDCKTYKTKIKKGGGVYESIGIKGIKELFVKHGMYGQVKLEKRLPSDIHTFDKKSLSEFIGGLYDADGNVYYNKKKNSIRVVLSSICEELLIEVKYQLMKFGIKSCVVKEKRNLSSVQEEYQGQKEFIFRLYINRNTDVNKFHDNIKLLVKNKQDVLSKIKEINTKNSIKNSDCYFEMTNEKGAYFKDMNLLKGMYPERITSIEFIGDKEIYNLNAGNTHTYLSNTFISANTGGELDSGAKGYDEMWREHEAYNLKPLFVSATHFFPGKGKDKDGKEIDFFDYDKGVTNREAAKEYILEDRKIASRTSKDVYIKHLQTYPLSPSEVFIKTKGGVLDLVRLNFQLKEIREGNSFEPVLRGRLDWVDSPETSKLLQRAKNLKEKTKIRIANGSKVKFVVDEEGPMYKQGNPINQNITHLNYKPDIGGCDSYDEQANEQNGPLSAGAIVAYRCFSGPTREFNYPVGVLCQRGDASFDDDEFYENAVKFAVYWDIEVLIEYSKILLFRYFHDVGAEKYLKNKPELEGGVTSNHRNTYGLKVQGLIPLLTKLLKLEIKENISKYFIESVVLDLMKFGEENTDISMALAMCLAHRMDIFEEITEDIEVDRGSYFHNNLTDAGSGYYIDIDGNLRSSMTGIENEVEAFIPERDLSSYEYKTYMDNRQRKKEEQEKREKDYIQRSKEAGIDKSILDLIIKEKQEWKNREQ